MTKARRVVIVGGGFAGLEAASRLGGSGAEVTLLDRRNHHLFQPLLYQVATGGLSPANIATPLRSLLRRHRNVRVLMANAVDVRAADRRVILEDGEVPYDTLVVAAGARHHYFGRPEWEPLAPGLKSIEDAVEIRRRIFTAFEAAEREESPAARASWTTFVIVGAGPTGVELAGALAELARATLVGDFRAVDPSRSRILLLEALDRVLPGYPADLSLLARRQLERLGVEVRTRCRVLELRPGRATVLGPGGPEEIETRTVLWAAGIQADPLAAALSRAAGAERDPQGRVKVLPDLSLPGRPEILVLGDMARREGPGGEPLPAVAPVAIQQGRYAADLIRRRMAGLPPPPPFRYLDRGRMATVGRAAAVAEIGRLRFGGAAAWLAWLGIHLMSMVQMENRLLVLTQWAWNYFTRNRSARLITGPQRW